MSSFVDKLFPFIGGSLFTYILTQFLNRGSLVFFFNKTVETYGRLNGDGVFEETPRPNATVRKIWFDFDVVNQSGYQKVARRFVYKVVHNGSEKKYPAWNGNVSNPSFNFEPKKTQRVHLHAFVPVSEIVDEAKVYLRYYDRKNNERFAITNLSHHNPLAD